MYTFWSQLVYEKYVVCVNLDPDSPRSNIPNTFGQMAYSKANGMETFGPSICMGPVRTPGGALAILYS